MLSFAFTSEEIVWKIYELFKDIASIEIIVCVVLAFRLRKNARIKNNDAVVSKDLKILIGLLFSIFFLICIIRILSIVLKRL